MMAQASLEVGHRISVVIPCLNEEECLRQCISSARSEPDVEIVVVDSGSQDESVRIARELGVRVVEWPWSVKARADGPGSQEAVVAGGEDRPARADALNTGAEAAGGDVLIFLHADTQLPTGYRLEVLACLDKGDRQGVSVVGAFRFKLAGVERRHCSMWTRLSLAAIEWGANIRSCFFSLPYGDQALFMRRAVYEELGRFPCEPFMEDLDFVNRARSIRGVSVRIANLAVETSARRWIKHGRSGDEGHAGNVTHLLDVYSPDLLEGCTYTSPLRPVAGRPVASRTQPYLCQSTPLLDNEVMCIKALTHCLSGIAGDDTMIVKRIDTLSTLITPTGIDILTKVNDHRVGRVVIVLRLQVPSGAMLRDLVDDQAILSAFWLEWKTAEHHFLTEKAAAGRCKQHVDSDDEDMLELERLLTDAQDPSVVPNEQEHQCAAPVGANEAQQGGTRLNAATGGSDTDGSAASSSTPRGSVRRDRTDEEPPDHVKQVQELEGLRQRVRDLESQLVDTEAFFRTEPGDCILALERDLAETKLRLSDAEAERDELEVRLMNLQGRVAKETPRATDNGGPRGLQWLAARTKTKSLQDTGE